LSRPAATLTVDVIAGANLDVIRGTNFRSGATADDGERCAAAPRSRRAAGPNRRLKTFTFSRDWLPQSSRTSPLRLTLNARKIGVFLHKWHGLC